MRTNSRRIAGTAVALLVGLFSLAACGSTNNSTVPGTTGSGGGGGTSGGTTAPGLTLSSNGLQFTTPNAPAQQFTVNSTTSGLTAPTIDASACKVNGTQIVTIAGGGGTLPATYTVTPNPALQQTPGALAGTYGNCTLVLTLGATSTALPILVGTNSSGPQTITASPASLTFATVGAAAQSFTVTGNAGTGPGTVAVNSAACTGIATVSGSGGTPPQTFSVTPTGSGTCSLVFVDGEVFTLVPISVAQTAGAAALVLSPSSVTFAAPNAAPQSVTVGFQGFVGQVTLDQTKCNGIATFTIPNGSLPQTGTVTPVAVGTCTITFTPSNAAAVTLAVNVQ